MCMIYEGENYTQLPVILFHSIHVREIYVMRENQDCGITICIGAARDYDPIKFKEKNK